jgi:DNA-binding FadR family transcriptional regulator
MLIRTRLASTFDAPWEAEMTATADAAGTPIRRIRSAKLSEVVARTLLDYILEEGLTAGDSLPNERDTIAWLGVARGSLREALRLLEAYGVITIKPGPGGGPVVRNPDPETFAGSTTMVMQYMRIPFGEVLTARIAFEPPVAAAAAEHRTDLQLAQLMASVEEMDLSVVDVEGFMTPYNAFHHTLAESTGNKVLLMAGVTFRNVWDIVHPEVEYSRNALLATTQAHRRMVEAIGDHAAGDAAEACRKHLSEYRTWLERHQPELLERPVIWTRST